MGGAYRSAGVLFSQHFLNPQLIFMWSFSSFTVLPSLTVFRLNNYMFTYILLILFICSSYPDSQPIRLFTRSSKPAGTRWSWSSCRTSMTTSSPVRSSSAEECCVPAVSCTGQSTRSGFRPSSRSFWSLWAWPIDCRSNCITPWLMGSF